jgi:hypothetical protein
MLKEKKISKEDYERINPYLRINDHAEADTFMSYSYEKISFGLCWSSSIHESPTFLHITENKTLLIGIANKIIGLSTENGQINFCLGIQDYLLAIEKINSGFVILTETFIIAVNLFDFSIRRINHIPEVITSYKIIGEKDTIVIDTNDETVLNINV